jgi:hypothetical protein
VNPNQFSRKDTETQRRQERFFSLSSPRLCVSARKLSARNHNSRRHRRGAIFIVALGITVVLSAMLLVYAQQMRTEGMSAANRVSMAQADAVEQGAEQWAFAQIEANVQPLSGSATSSTTTPVDPTTIPAEALQVGGGYFWILHPDPTQDQLYGFGLVDEASKINLNGDPTTLAAELALLPNMAQDIATNISNYPGTAGPSGSPITYETVEQLMMVDNMTELTPQVLYGYDLNRDGVIDNNERNAAGGSAVSNGTTQDSRGIFNFVTVYSTTATPGTQGTALPTAVRGRVTPATIGLINPATASYQVLMCLPGMTPTTVQALISQRTSTVPTPGDLTWVTTALGQTSTGLLPLFTPYSYQYSADIVAVSGNGRAFKRVRVVIDARSSPAKIVYRKDLTNLGWPLPPEVRTSLQQGKGVPVEVTGTSNKQTSGGF